MAVKKEAEKTEAKVTAKKDDEKVSIMVPYVEGEDPEVDEKVSIMVPYVEGEDPEVTVIINGHYTRFRKGETVKVSRAVASVLQNSNKQMMSALDNQKKFKNQVTDL